MARIMTRVDIPITNPNKMTQLLDSITNHHQKLGNGSPLLTVPGMDMVDFAEKINLFKEKRNEAQRLFAESQALMQEARTLLGVDAGQSIHTPDTLYYLTDRIKQYLLLHYSFTHEELSPFGFNVVVSMVKVGRKKKPKGNLNTRSQ